MKISFKSLLASLYCAVATVFMIYPEIFGVEYFSDIHFEIITIGVLTPVMFICAYMFFSVLVFNNAEESAGK